MAMDYGTTKMLGISNGPFLQQALHFFADWHLQFLGSRCFRKFASKWKGRFKGWSEGEEFLANGNDFLGAFNP
jgi:hypothetical protein